MKHNPIRGKKISHFSVGWLALLILTSSIFQCAPNTGQNGPYLVLYAFEAEGALLANQMGIKNKGRDLGRLVYSGRLSGKNVVLAESGIGMTNAAMMTQRFIDQFHPKAVIFTGIAGAVDSTIQIGDIVVCREWITHDFVYLGPDEPKPKTISVYSPLIDSMTSFGSFEVDSTMFADASKLAGQKIDLKPIETRSPRLRIGGIGVSGNAFIDNKDKRIWLKSVFDAQITDMETAAVAQVCLANGVPFIAFRSASDLAGGSGSASARAELELFYEVAAENSSTVVAKYLSSL